MDNINKDKKIRILCLDGGGIRGLITAHILKEIEKQLQCVKGESLREYFDMIAGTSTGSILAAGIATGIPIDKMIEMYQNEGNKIFPEYNFWGKLKPFKRVKSLFKYGLPGLSVPYYDNQGLIDILKREDIFGEETTLKDVGRCQEKKDYYSEPNPILLILAYDTLYRNTTFFTNYYCEDEYPNHDPWYYKKPLWEICTSSAAAPTFFPGYELEHKETPRGSKEETWSFPHVDGGVTANNPSLCAIARALELGYQLENISLLSIGTGQDTEPYEFEQIEDWGLANWARRITNVFMGGQAEVQDRICRSLMGGRQSKRYLRLQFELNQTMREREDLDDNNKIYAQKRVIPEKKWPRSNQNKNRVNKLINQHIDNKMDNANQDNINKLNTVVTAFINNENSYSFETKDFHGSQVKKAINDFINERAQEKIEY